MNTYLFSVCVLLHSAWRTMAWHYFTSLIDHTLHNSAIEETLVNSEYTFGNCQRRDIKLLAHTHLESLDVAGKNIIRGWLNISRMPTCIIIRGMSYRGDFFRRTSYAFQMCTPRIAYCHSQRRYKYFYYEWYLPADYAGGMNFELYFLGSNSREWW